MKHVFASEALHRHRFTVGAKYSVTLEWRAVMRDRYRFISAWPLVVALALLLVLHATAGHLV
jgi:hypothetical protein